ncbi:MAG: hypothetical protein KBF75_04325 [Saprospiraceae bacterium]|jgi:hypothetical protein|nr:hypothetical protein [Saprospiraceae bacterium]HMT78179.1 hypothetical protein [Saprospiraceae bacterium]HQU95369.1 hypothetical protein [Saprospiraceae bacterium]HQW96011.1 hypothetical protein [Saprospiraceae bacterium]
MKVNFCKLSIIYLPLLIMMQNVTAQVTINKDIMAAYEIQKANTIEELRDLSEIGTYVGTAFITCNKEDTLNLDDVVFPVKRKDTFTVPTVITEQDKETQELNADVMYVFSKYSGDTLYCRMGFFYSTTIIEHRVFQGNVQSEYMETMGDFKALKLNIGDTLTNTVTIPIKIKKIELSTADFKPDETMYGYCELETTPFYRLIDPEDSNLLKVKKRLKYYFSFKIRGNKD